ncbi:MAG: c-type cytochrome [Ferruginibacter sp.]
MLEGLAQGIKDRNARTGFNEDQPLLVANFFKTPSAQMRTASLHLLQAMGLRDGELKNEAMSKAAAMAGDESLPEEKRVAAIRFISMGNLAPYTDLLETLITPREKSSLQIASLQTLSAIPGTTATQYLLRYWTSLTPEVQDEAMNTFLEDTARISMLWDAMEKGKVLPASVGWQRSVSLMAQDNLRLREKARRLLTKSDEDRVKVNKEYQQVLSMDGAAGKGKEVYVKNCSSCHQVRGTLGFSFGPDLGTIHNWSADAIMANILAPNLSISSGYDPGT